MTLWRGSVLPMSRLRRPRRSYGVRCAPRKPANRTRVERSCSADRCCQSSTLSRIRSTPTPTSRVQVAASASEAGIPSSARSRPPNLRVSAASRGKTARGWSPEISPLGAAVPASARRRASPTGGSAATASHGHSCHAFGCPFLRDLAASIKSSIGGCAERSENFDDLMGARCFCLHRRARSLQ
jgi:hypothetical protein